MCNYKKLFLDSLHVSQMLSLSSAATYLLRLWFIQPSETLSLSTEAFAVKITKNIQCYRWICADHANENLSITLENYTIYAFNVFTFNFNRDFHNLVLIWIRLETRNYLICLLIPDANNQQIVIISLNYLTISSR